MSDIDEITFDDADMRQLHADFEPDLHGGPLGDRLRSRRIELGLSLRQLEARSGIHRARLSRYERGDDVPRRTERVVALAAALDIPAAELELLTRREALAPLPSLPLYLRTKFGDELPPEAVAEIAAYGRRVARRYGVNTGPAPGEDE